MVPLNTAGRQVRTKAANHIKMNFARETPSEADVSDMMKSGSKTFKVCGTSDHLADRVGHGFTSTNSVLN
jgi:hypothetical protein